MIRSRYLRCVASNSMHEKHFLGRLKVSSCSERFTVTGADHQICLIRRTATIVSALHQIQHRESLTVRRRQPHRHQQLYRRKSRCSLSAPPFLLSCSTLSTRRGVWDPHELSDPTECYLQEMLRTLGHIT